MVERSAAKTWREEKAVRRERGYREGRMYQNGSWRRLKHKYRPMIVEAEEKKANLDRSEENLVAGASESHDRSG